MRRSQPLSVQSLRLLLVVSLILGLPGCGGGGSSPDPGFGTVALLNETDLGMAPQVVTAFFFEPVGASGQAANLLTQDLEPGAIVNLGPWPEGLYNAVAVLASGSNVTFLDIPVAADQPTNVVIPSL